MTTEPPRPEQIQANVAAALSRLRGELAPSGPTAPASPAPAETMPAEALPADAKPAAESGLTSGESLFNVGPTLSAPDPSMALGGAGDDAAETPLSRLTGGKPTEQPDLQAGIGAPPLADIPDAEAEAAKRRRRMRNRLLAGGALIVIVAGFWLWSGGREGGNEAIPVITADQSPEKVKPADEGGLDVPNQDVAILNGDNSAATNQGETVLPAPEQPATPPTPPESPPEPAPAATADTAQPADNGIPSVAAPSVDNIPSVSAPAEPGATAPATPEVGAATAPATGETQIAAADAAPAATGTADQAPAEAAPAEAAPAAAPAAEPAAAPADAGSIRIQLAAVKSESAAAKEWARLQKASPDVLGSLTLHVERFKKSPGEVYYRIQAGPFADKAAAKAACAELKQKDQACIVAR